MERMETSKTLNGSVVDPVCGMNVAPTQTHLPVTRNGNTYYFCAEGCRKAFEVNPKKYLKGKVRKNG